MPRLPLNKLRAVIINLKRAGKYVKRGFDKGSLERANAIARVVDVRHKGKLNQIRRAKDELYFNSIRATSKAIRENNPERSVRLIKGYEKGTKILGSQYEKLKYSQPKAVKVYQKLRLNRGTLKAAAIGIPALTGLSLFNQYQYNKSNKKLKKVRRVKS